MTKQPTFRDFLPDTFVSIMCDDTGLTEHYQTSEPEVFQKICEEIHQVPECIAFQHFPGHQSWLHIPLRKFLTLSCPKLFHDANSINRTNVSSSTDDNKNSDNMKVFFQESFYNRSRSDWFLQFENNEITAVADRQQVVGLDWRKWIQAQKSLMDLDGALIQLDSLLGGFYQSSLRLSCFMYLQHHKYDFSYQQWPQDEFIVNERYRQDLLVVQNHVHSLMQFMLVSGEGKLAEQLAELVIDLSSDQASFLLLLKKQILPSWAQIYKKLIGEFKGKRKNKKFLQTTFLTPSLLKASKLTGVYARLATFNLDLRLLYSQVYGPTYLNPHGNFPTKVIPKNFVALYGTYEDFLDLKCFEITRSLYNIEAITPRITGESFEASLYDMVGQCQMSIEHNQDSLLIHFPLVPVESPQGLLATTVLQNPKNQEIAYTYLKSHDIYDYVSKREQVYSQRDFLQSQTLLFTSPFFH